ncbi:MAG: response regulator, partial [Oscillochloris sp.]|nr:response regulator [Oscillochloris sp.]
LPYHPPKIAATQSPGILQPELRAATNVGSSARILLAEDNEMNILAISDYLQSKGHQMVIARNGREAIDQFSETQPDLILMDIQMPEMDGLEAIRRLRALPECATTPIIALTALAMPGDRERCLDAGASAYMMKPISLRGLTEIINQLVEIKEPSAVPNANQ